MSYLNPGQLFQEYFQPTVKSVLPIVPSLMANRRAQEESQLREGLAQMRWQNEAGLRAAQARHYNAQAAESEEARKALVAIMGGQQVAEGFDIKPEEAARKIARLSPAPQAPQPTYRDQQIIGRLKYTLGRDPNPQEIANEFERIRKEEAEQKKQILVNNPIQPQTPDRKPELKGILSNGSPVSFNPDVGLVVKGKDPYDPKVHGEIKPITQERPYFPVIWGPGGAYQVNTRQPGAEAIPVNVPGQPGGGGGGQLLKPLPTSEGQELADLKVTHDRLIELADISEKLKDKFGPIEGNWNKLKVKFLEDGDVQFLSNELESLITMAYGLSGKQISYIEMQMLKKAIIPQMTQPYANFRSTLDFATRWIDSTHDNRLDYYRQSGFGSNIKPLGQQQGAAPQKPKAGGGGWKDYDTQPQTPAKTTEPKTIRYDAQGNRIQ